MAHEVFISYSSRDKTIADAVVAAMESNGIRCWYSPRDIRSGADWGKAITHAIESSKLFLLIFSGHANQSQRVLDELNLAISCEAHIIPFRVENLEPAGAMRLHLTSRHWLDAYDPSWEQNLQKLIQTVSATLEIVLDEGSLKLPAMERGGRAASGRKIDLRLGVGILAAVLIIIAAWYSLTELNSRGEELPPANSPDLTLEAEPTAGLSASESTTMPLDWAAVEFTIPGNGLWQKMDGRYTAIGSEDTIAWSEKKYTGDIEISLDIESSYSFAAANIIVYGNGMSLSPGNLIFTVANDLLAISQGSIYGEGNYLYSSLSTLNFKNEAHSVLISIMDQKAMLYVDGEMVGAVFLDDDIRSSGRIGLLKYWEINEIVFSNIRIRGSEAAQ